VGEEQEGEWEEGLEEKVDGRETDGEGVRERDREARGRRSGRQ
jgi:hypothetical protein